LHWGGPSSIILRLSPFLRTLYRAWRADGTRAAESQPPGTDCLQEFSLRKLKIMNTFSAKPAEVRRDWFVVDATGKTLGRLSTEIARRLRGKHKPEYTPHVDTGDYIVVVNAEKIRVTGNKLQDKIYYHHTGYIGNLKSISLEKLLDKAPERVIEKSVKGMLPRGPLGRQMFSKLKVFAGPEHSHAAQQPIPLEVNA